MTREEAIKWLEEAVNDTNNDFDLCSEALKKELLLQKDVFEMAISALTHPHGEWISVKDRLPEKKQRVIVRCRTVGTTVGWILWREWLTDLGKGCSEVTHWMPLPEPPEDRG